MASKKQAPFAEQFSELEEITRWFERGDVDLDEGLKKYERGLVLAALCKDRLREIENTVVALKKQYSAEPSEDSGTLL
ncbi:exodeoxyribonuclease VII small subunit [bacterium]|nr:exodeoxyribonuclease VII small subunit [bacterium]NBX50052.1 exodeoxyribonuclease VII small subunit [bacterium]